MCAEVGVRRVAPVSETIITRREASVDAIYDQILTHAYINQCASIDVPTGHSPHHCFHDSFIRPSGHIQINNYTPFHLRVNLHATHT